MKLINALLANHRPGISKRSVLAPAVDPAPVLGGFTVRIGLCFLLLVAGPSVVPALAEVWPRFERLTNEEGLSQASVLALAQDHRGFVWVGTETGVERFDGYSVETFEIAASGVVRAIEPAADGGLWVGHLGGGLIHVQPETGAVESFLHDATGADGLPSNRVRVVIDERGVIDWGVASESRATPTTREPAVWVATENGLARLRSTSPGEAEKAGTAADKASSTARFDVWQWDEEGHEGPRKNLIYALAADGEGGWWLGTEAGLGHLDPLTGRAAFWQHAPEEEGSLPEGAVRSILVDARGGLWLGIESDLVYFDIGTSRSRMALREVVWPEGADAQIPITVWDLVADGHDQLWLALGRAGLGLFDPRTGELRILPREGEGHPAGTEERMRLPSGAVLELFRDRSGLVWCGISPAGAFYFDPSFEGIERYLARRSDASTLASSIVLDLLEQDSGDLWIGSMGGGLERRDGKTGRFERWRAEGAGPDRLSADNVSAMLVAPDGRLWVGTSGGLDLFDPTAGTFEHFRHDPADDHSLPADNIEALVYDSEQRLWIGTTEGLARLEADGRFTRFPPDPEHPRGVSQRQIMALEAGREGAIWVATWGGGVDYFDPETETFRRHRHAPGAEASKARDAIRALWVDSEGRAWAGTDGAGIHVIDPESGEIRHLGESDGMVNDVVQCILGDARGRVWIATNQGLSLFDPKAETWTTFDRRDGLQDLEFDHDACTRGPSGRLYFGGIAGYNVVRPEAVELLPPPPIRFTRFEIVESDGRPIARSPASHSLELGAGDRSLTFEFAALGYLRTDKSRYAYKLDGFDQSWVELGTRNFGRYTNLPAGDYTLRVRGSNGHGIWNETGESVQLRVYPPWWRTRWALALWLALGLGSIYGYTRFQTLRIRREQEINARLRDVDRFKDEFLASTSHELRTPLYGITGLAESLLEHPAEPLDAETRSDLGLIVASGRRLSALVDDILDVARLQRGGLELRHGVIDLHSLADVVMTLSTPLVGQKPVELSNRVPTDLPRAWADENRLQQILHNLLGNAIKFTQRGRVELTAEVEKSTDEAGSSRLVVAVSDTGIGIAGSEQDKIFRAFEQAGDAGFRIQGGIGLGLAISRQLVEMHGGQLWLESEPGRGSTFFFSLPVATEAQLEAAKISSEIPLDLAADVAAEVRQVAVIEDVRDVAGVAMAEAASGADASAPNASAPDVGIPESVTADGTDGGPTRPGMGLAYGERSEALRARGQGTSAPEAASLLRSPNGGPPNGGSPSNIPAPTVPLTSSLVLREVGRSRLLVVDDEAIIRRVLTSQLIAGGYEVDAVKDGPAALDAVDRANYDLVLLDVMMPGMSGFEVCRRLRTRFDASELPVILLTAKSRAGDRVTGLEQGANDYLTKPVALDELRARVRTHLGLLDSHRAVGKQLEARLDEVRMLGQMVPICATCKKVRSDHGFWDEVEVFLESEYGTRLSHGICPSCLESALEEVEQSPEPS